MVIVAITPEIQSKSRRGILTMMRSIDIVLGMSVTGGIGLYGSNASKYSEVLQDLLCEVVICS
jgi:hypothetical protein